MYRQYYRRTDKNRAEIIKRLRRDRKEAKKEIKGKKLMGIKEVDDFVNKAIGRI